MPSFGCCQHHPAGLNSQIAPCPVPLVLRGDRPGPCAGQGKRCNLSNVSPLAPSPCGSPSGPVDRECRHGRLYRAAAGPQQRRGNCCGTRRRRRRQQRAAAPRCRGGHLAPLHRALPKPASAAAPLPCTHPGAASSGRGRGGGRRCTGGQAGRARATAALRSHLCPTRPPRPAVAVGKVAGSFYLIVVDGQPSKFAAAMLRATLLYAASTALYAASSWVVGKMHGGDWLVGWHVGSITGAPPGAGSVRPHFELPCTHPALPGQSTWRFRGASASPPTSTPATASTSMPTMPCSSRGSSSRAGERTSTAPASIASPPAAARSTILTSALQPMQQSCVRACLVWLAWLWLHHSRQHITGEGGQSERHIGPAGAVHAGELQHTRWPKCRRLLLSCAAARSWLTWGYLGWRGLAAVFAFFWLAATVQRCA